MLGLKKILLPVDFSDRAEGSARYAQAIASCFCSHITLLHVEHDPFLVRSEELKGPPMGSIEHTLWLRARLESFLKDELQGRDVTRVVMEGDPATKIVELARAEDVDLILMPTSGHRPLRQFLWGSALAKVLHDCNCPIWTGVHLNDSPPGDLLSFKKIACAIDLGPHTRSALSWASEFASAFGALLLVIHIAKPSGNEQVEAPARDSQVQLVKRARGDIENLLDDLDVKADIAVGSGSAPEVICEFTLGFGADVLVVGRCPSSGRLHSDTHTIIRQSHCPVVSV